MKIQQSMSLHFNSALCSLFTMNISTHYNLRRLIYSYAFASTCKSINIPKTQFLKINVPTCQLASGEISIHINEIPLCYINRDTYINVDFDGYRYFKLGLDAYLNIHSSTYCYNYLYLLESIEIIQSKYFRLWCGLSSHLVSQFWEQIYLHMAIYVD